MIENFNLWLLKSSRGGDEMQSKRLFGCGASG